MSERFTSYDDAYDAARVKADQAGRAYGILRQREFGRDGFNVFCLPRPGNRFGFELRAEVVEPGSPRCESPDTWTEPRGSALERRCSCGRYYVPTAPSHGACPQCRRERGGA